MVLSQLKLQNFRNISSLSMRADPKVNVIFGDNAQGKTNLLESVFFLSCVKSLHAKKEAELVKFCESDAMILANILSHRRDFEIRINLSATKKRQIFVNSIKQNKLLDYVGLVQTVLFSPSDLNLMRSGPSARRRFVNIALSQLKPKYLQVLSQYQKVLDEKNKLLKQAEIPDMLLDVYNERLAVLGASVISYRAAFLENLATHAKTIHGEMSQTKEDFTAVYQTDRYAEPLIGDEKAVSEAIYRHFCERKIVEIDSRICLVGPHRDDLDCLINGSSVRQFASQGQTRTAVLALKLAERNLFFEAMGEYPILLLDDVLSELDSKRQDFVLNQITNGQVFITSCDPSAEKLSRSGKIFTMKQGILSE
ncbi:MAG: DNA replication/repair protein RecF [Ruminococcaceae bacterium]|nr:DNA replication/repair protein RecF [Oscillospiraceae bacterium]